MQDRRRRILEDLAGALKGDLRCDALTTSMYATDSSLYQIEPLGVACPRDTEDVVTLVRYAHEKELSLVARGAGTGLAGSAIGAGLIVDFSRYMRAVEAIGENHVRVQPGIVRDELNQLLLKQGRYFPPDPSNSAVTTIGGMLAVDAAGSHCVRVGSSRDHVKSLEVVLADGTVIEAGSESLRFAKPPPASTVTPDFAAGSIATDPQDRLHNELPPSDAKRTIVSRLAKLLNDNAELISIRQPPLIRNTCGYYLRGIVDAAELHLARMLVGSEGTLGLFTSATLHTAPLPPHRGVALQLFGDLESAITAVGRITPHQPSACDLLDRRLLSLAREADPRFARMIPQTAEAALLVEMIGFSDRQVRDRMREVESAVRAAELRMQLAHEAYDPAGVDFLWSLPGRVVPLLTRLTGSTRPVPLVEDIAVPPAVLSDFLVQVQRVFQKHDVTASLYAHAASGQLHLRPFMLVPSPGDGARLETLARDVYQIVFQFGGTISGEHGDGLVRTSFIRSQYGALYRVFQQIKEIFDPHNILNPGKIVSDDGHLTRKNLRPAGELGLKLTELKLKWKPSEMLETAAECNGCGVCKTQGPESRMCPIFRLNPMEDASPRAKANVLRNFATGSLDASAMVSPEMQQLSRLCFNCKQCQLDCPTSVNIPHLMTEARAHYVAANGLSRAEGFVLRMHLAAHSGIAALFGVNWLLNKSSARWLLEKSIGISRHRKLPQFASRSFVASVRRQLGILPVSQSKQKAVVYFVDHFANHYDPELGRAFVSILQYNGIPVLVPPRQMPSGMALISAGELDAARDLARHNIRELAELAREGHPIVCTEPSAALCLIHEYPRLIEHPDVKVVARQTVDAGQFLQMLHDEGRLRTDFGPLNLTVGYHMPCHLKALGGGSSLLRILTLIPKLKTHTIEQGCSGMAGVYGLLAENFDDSLTIGAGLIARMQAGDLNAGTTECSSCRMQMEQDNDTPTLHPIKLLALAYGLMPAIEKKLQTNTNRLVMS